MNKRFSIISETLLDLRALNEGESILFTHEGAVFELKKIKSEVKK